MDGKTYPARLVDLPCVVETQKTLDRSTFFKSGDVGQMLVVYKVRLRGWDPRTGTALEGLVVEATPSLSFSYVCTCVFSLFVVESHGTCSTLSRTTSASLVYCSAFWVDVVRRCLAPKTLKCDALLAFPSLNVYFILVRAR